MQALTIVLFILLAFNPKELAGECYDCYGYGYEDYDDVIFEPHIPAPDGWYEKVTGLTSGIFKDPETGESFRVCILHLENIELELGDSVPVDIDGTRMILDFDEVTFRSPAELRQSVNLTDCTFYEIWEEIALGASAPFHFYGKVNDIYEASQIHRA